MRRSLRRTRPWAGLLAAVVGLTLAAPPSWASEAMPAPAPAPQSLRAATAAKLATLDTANGVRMSQDPGAAPASDAPKSFFKSRKGAIALLLLAGGTTWAVVSRNRDAVHSPARN